MKHETTRTRRGFTLIELLIVVAVIGILVAIGVPNYMTARDRADRAACAGNMKTLGWALAAYKLDFDFFPLADGVAGPEPSPGTTDPGNGPAANGSWDGVPRVLLEMRYVTDENVLYCPALRRRHGDNHEHFRYAYNSASAGAGGAAGGANNINFDPGDVWLVRCLWVPPEIGFNPGDGIVYPHGDEEQEDGTIERDVMENVLYRDFRVGLSNGRRDFMEQ